MQITSPSILVLAIGLAHTAATTALTPLLINGHLFIPINTAGANERNTFVRQSEIDAAATDTGAAWSVGDKIYWDDTAKKFTKTATANTLCGYALEAKASGAAVSGLIAFNSFAA